MGKYWSRVTSLASMCWMALLVIGGIGLALNWNLFIVAGGMLAIFAVGLGVIFMPGLLKQWHVRTTQVIDREAKELSEKLAKHVPPSSATPSA